MYDCEGVPIAHIKQLILRFSDDVVGRARMVAALLEYKAFEAAGVPSGDTLSIQFLCAPDTSLDRFHNEATFRKVRPLSIAFIDKPCFFE